MGGSWACWKMKKFPEFDERIRKCFVKYQIYVNHGGGFKKSRTSIILILHICSPSATWIEMNLSISTSHFSPSSSHHNLKSLSRYVKKEKLLFLLIVVFFAAVNVWKWWPDELVDGVRRSGLSLMRCSTEGRFFGREENDNADFWTKENFFFEFHLRCSRHSESLLWWSNGTRQKKKKRKIFLSCELCALGGRVMRWARGWARADVRKVAFSSLIYTSFQETF